ncbi:MAG TPA: MXAN_5187 C-terminal domain-containing protein [Thermoanaerobaculia bacterium]|nr:MXAN_5187 C-terminal domain-containing protein [Thermoanaerobaculia bacterium]
MSLEKEFAAFEEAITRMGKEYDVFLYGTRGARLPAEGRRRLQQMARSLSTQKLDSPADRFRLNTLLGRYNAQVEFWERAVRDKEEGRGRFARGLPAAVPNVPPASSVHREAASSPDEALFVRFLEARRGNGDDVSRLSFEKFREQLAREREALAARTGRTEWEFDVAGDKGRVRLIARPLKGKTP